ncbi:MucR family transcriptional regulator [Flavisphingomonas formosensis]|uniref:MucR family transcriptional regulator n=1 Tax=Flavisphingomonas formosensis TaxID=861534 RepID=UPI001E56622B|nr:MucR family transcriptional regulator [Sphingomonas formosensis]
MPDTADHIALTVEVVASFVSHNELPPEDVAAFIGATHAAIAALKGEGAASATAPPAPCVPAVSARASLASREHILSLIDGKPYKSLKRHLRAHGLTPDQYRAQFGLKPDYPMVAPAYSETRRAVAVALGLGRKAGVRLSAARLEN